MKKEFSKNTTEVFTKTIFHYVPEILKYIDEIKEPRKRCPIGDVSFWTFQDKL